MLPLDLLIAEMKRSDGIKSKTVKNIQTKKNKKMRFDVINLIFDFKNNLVEIQDDIGVTDQRIQRLKIVDFLAIINLS